MNKTNKQTTQSTGIQFELLTYGSKYLTNGSEAMSIGHLLLNSWYKQLYKQ